MKTVAVPLLGKGATNHLHRQEIVDEFRKEGVQVVFLVREDYAEIIDHLSGCNYVTYVQPKLEGWRKTVAESSFVLRYMYPSSDAWRAWRYRVVRSTEPKTLNRFYFDLLYRLSGLKWLMRLAIRVEGAIFKQLDSRVLDELRVDGVLLIGVGTWTDNFTAPIAWWAVRKNLPLISFVGNYDGLASKGYRGYDVKKVLVWGPRMREDAAGFHDIPRDRIREVGPIRYNSLLATAKPVTRADFFKSRGLDPDAITFTFAGSSHDFHYFEILSVYSLLKAMPGRKIQMIVRVYPNQDLMRSAHMDAFLDYVRKFPDISVSLADPKHESKEAKWETLQIEEYDLWNILQFSDVVVNIFSTLTIEACIFDKPVVNMWYFPRASKALRQAVYRELPLALHIRRVIDSGAAETATSREQLVALIEDALKDPARRSSQRRQLVHDECGALDARCAERVAKEVSEALGLT